MNLFTSADVLQFLQLQPQFGHFFQEIVADPKTPRELLLPGGASVTRTGYSGWCVISADRRTVTHCHLNQLAEVAAEVMGWKRATDGMTAEQIVRANATLNGGLSL